MVFSFAVVLMAAVFAMQLFLCRKAERLWIRLIPLVLIALGELARVAGYIVSIHMEQAGEGIYGASFATVIFGCILLYLLAADTLAWAVSAIVSYVQKRRK